jgi:hypothetical protein
MLPTLATFAPHHHRARPARPPRNMHNASAHRRRAHSTPSDSRHHATNPIQERRDRRGGGEREREEGLARRERERERERERRPVFVWNSAPSMAIQQPRRWGKGKEREEEGERGTKREKDREVSTQTHSALQIEPRSQQHSFASPHSSPNAHYVQQQHHPHPRFRAPFPRSNGRGGPSVPRSLRPSRGRAVAMRGGGVAYVGAPPGCGGNPMER